MVTLGEAVQDEVASDKSQRIESLDSGYHEPQSNQDGNALYVFSEKEKGELLKTRPDAELFASRCSVEGNNLSTKSEKELDNMQQKMSSDSASRDQTSQSSQEGTPLSVIPLRVFQSQSPDSTNWDHTSVINQDGTLLSQMPESFLDNIKQRHRSGNGGTSAVNQELEKVPDCLQLSQSANSESQLQCEQEGRNSSRIPDKPSEDGYNWRKYGQKLVKGNEFTRSYYRCTHPNCPAKRQVERLQGAHITGTIYLGKHDHPQPQASLQMAVGFVMPLKKRQDEPSLAIGEDKSANSQDPTSHHVESAKCTRLAITPPPDVAVEGAISQSNRTTGAVHHGGIPISKRQKRDITDISEPLVEKPNCEPRVVLQTMSEVDIVNDGYRWRKYGQKFVKGNANPRSYYRCSNAGCPVKKHVERASHDPKVVLTTYEGQHAHDMPPARTVTVNTAGANSNLTSLNGESTSRPDENSAVGLELVVHTTAN